MANFSGSVILSPRVSLHNVLYIVNLFNLNLLTNSLPLHLALCFFLLMIMLSLTQLRGRLGWLKHKMDSTF